MNFTDDCKIVINRILEAYGFKTLKMLSSHLNIGVSVLSNRILRNKFPHDLVLTCILETGASPLWLCTGQGELGIDGVQVAQKGVILSDDVLDKLERLGTLKEKGLITEQEFNILKANLI